MRPHASFIRWLSLLWLATCFSLAAAQPARIVSLAPSWSHTTSAIGAEDLLVGVTRYARFPDSIPAAVERGELTVVGGFTDFDIDKIKSLNPSVVLTATGLQLGVKKQLEEQGLTVIHMQESSLTEVYQQIHALGNAVGKQQGATDLVAQIKTELQQVVDKYAHLPKVSVYYEINYQYKCVPGADNYLTEIMRMVGAEPILAERSGVAPQVFWNEVVTANPDVILLPTWPNAEKPVFEGAMAGNGTTYPNEVIRREGAAKVTAVQSGKVGYIDSAVTKQAGPNIANAARLIAEAVHLGQYAPAPYTQPE